MTHQIYPCLWFDGNAKTAAEFYCSLFKNSKVTTDTPMVVNFELNGKKIMGLNGGPMYKINPSISFFVTCKSLAETDELWNKLIDGGKALIPMDKYEWSDRYGWVQDKFGLTWQISVEGTNGSGQDITPSFLFTREHFGEAAEAIALYSSLFPNSGLDMMVNYPPGDANEGKVMYAEFNLDGYNLIAMDGPGVHEYTFDEGVSFVVYCDTQQEIDYYWNKLTANGGKEVMCGWLTDKFGVSWQIVPSNIGELISNKQKGDRAMKALLKMVKIDIETLVNA